MANQVKFKLNLPGLNELMKSAEMQAALSEAGAEVAAIAGEGYAHDTHVANFVAIENVYTATGRAYGDNMKNNTLEKALRQAGLPTTK